MSFRKLEGKSILIISPEKWGANFVSKHHYARYLSENNEVFFLNPALPYKTFSICVESKKVQERLLQISYTNPLPKLDRWPLAIQNQVFRRIYNKVCREAKIKEFDLVWSFDPFRFYELDLLPTGITVYHCVDVHWNARFESKVAKRADVVLACAEALRDRLVPFNSKSFKISHGADLRGFETSAKVELVLPGKNNIKVGLIGNFNGNVDYTTLKELSRQNPNIDLILVGPYVSSNLGTQIANPYVQDLMKVPNVYFVGEVPGDMLMAYIQKFDINLVLYKNTGDPRDMNINSHKLMGYFWAGNATVSSFLSEYANAPLDLIYLVKENSEFPKMIQKLCLHIADFNKGELRSMRRQYALDNSYEFQIQRIEKIIFEHQRK